MKNINRRDLIKAINKNKGNIFSVVFLKKDGSDHIFISAPENVAWLLNIRGRDNPFSPIPNCRIIINTKGEVSFFSDLKNQF